MINVLNDHDDYSEQQNLKMNVNVILNVLFVCLFVLQSENKFCAMN